MGDVGVTGHYNGTPPSNYCPSVARFRFISENYLCEKCDNRFENETEVEKSQTNATNVTLHLFRQAIWGDIWQSTVEKKSNKCNQCDYASSDASNLRTHLKTHSGEKPSKCNQCDFASSQASYLRRHLTKHNGEKVKQMQPTWLCIFLCTSFENTFENAQWRIKKGLNNSATLGQMSPMWKH